MATSVFIYVFDNPGPYRFVDLCGELLGKLSEDSSLVVSVLMAESIRC
jgi:hypothetical protein